MTAPQVLLVPGNPLDLTEEKLQELIEDLSTDFTTEYSSRPMGGRGVTWWEVLAIYLATKGADALIGHATVQAVDQIVNKVRRWVRRRRSAIESNIGVTNFCSFLDPRHAVSFPCTAKKLPDSAQASNLAALPPGQYTGIPQAHPETEWLPRF